MSKITPVLLAILDGWGIGEPWEGNAIHLANTPNMDRWQANQPATTLVAHNGAVGLPEGQMGNSEVGHLNIGAGRIVYQDFTRINRDIETGDFIKNEALVKVFGRAVTQGTALHLLGLVSDGGVHSHIRHLIALLEMAKHLGLAKVYVHAFMDGRDTPPQSGAGYMAELAEAIKRIGVGRIASVCGRYYAMDRDNRWDRVSLAWQAMVDGKGQHTATDAVEAVTSAYGRGENDEFIKPTVIVDNGQPLATINDGDSVIFFNFRADRARQLTHVFIDQEFAGFSMQHRPQLADFLTFTVYEKDFNLAVAFPPVPLTHILGEEVSSHGLRQLRIAETEKYAHVTYFFNGGREAPFSLEDRALLPSPREVATYDLKPEMSADAVTEELLRRLADNPYSLVVLNFANCDMVGHSGIMAAAITAVETVDRCIGRVVERFTELGGVVLITADHGNAEVMINKKTGGPVTAHSTNPVPLVMLGGQPGLGLKDGGTLTNLAPTILELMGLPIPAEMESVSLLVRK
ncbi:MAG: 2,3-bisphosphoglycerate-independent phosphoglycerate mutase [Proteobacteria bacterium]|nr:2,3-bisphosphoglycerate-independent phosphoglycerate mutase [Pseudomonadota bacterium]MBU1547393.1 2,3-bisphosphoglycerate-independent phosphoglycerate mutase [Pseudomonadota bacterium]MBU2618999.1 2,3-bisphosphoglycerate-independent phosphoglycerate mutase [Pseudomonadota bacterium]